MRIVIPACVMGIALFFGAALPGCQKESSMSSPGMQGSYQQSQDGNMQDSGNSMKADGSMKRGGGSAGTSY